MKEDKIFTFSENSLEKELASLEKEKIRQVRVSQKSITENKQKLLRFVSLAEKIAPEVLYQFEIPLFMIDRETVAAFSSIYSSLDIEFDSIEGNFSKNLSKKANLLNEAGLIFGFVVNLKDISIKSFKSYVDFMILQYPNHINFVTENLKPTNVLSTQDIKTVENLCFAIECFYTFGRAVPWFLSVVNPLRIKPSVFLSDFAEWQRCNNCSLKSGFNPKSEHHLVIEKMLLSFLKFKYEEKKLFHAFPVVEDLVKLQGAFARACGEGEETVLDLSYSPEDLFSPYSQDILAFSEEVCMEACSVKVFNTEEGPDFKLL